jgi:Holliday junction DNA helicase RuvA
MIAYLAGMIKHLDEDALIVSAGGVGYWVLAPSSVIQKALLHDKTHPFEIWCVQHIREDSMTLYGFETLFARDLFMLLTAIPGVGGRVALNLFSALQTDGLLSALLCDDKQQLLKADGVGPKLATRLLTELQGKRPQLLRCAHESAQEEGGGAPVTSLVQEETLKALEQLGYARTQTAPLVQELCTDIPDTLTTEALLKRMLQVLAKKAAPSQNTA